VCFFVPLQLHHNHLNSLSAVASVATRTLYYFWALSNKEIICLAMASVTPSVTSSPTVAQDLGSSIFLTWLSNSSPEKIHKVLNSIEDEKAKISLMGMLIKSPPKQHVILEQPVAPRAAAMAPVKLKKALNAFVGFRSRFCFQAHTCLS